MRKLAVYCECAGDFLENTYLVVDENSKEAVLVDPGHRVPRLEQRIADEKLIPIGILLTHGHLDHIASVPYYQHLYEIPVGACAKEKDLLENPQKNLTYLLPEGSIALTPTIWYEEGDKALLDLLVREAPGHTAGGCLYYGEDFLLAGDTIFAGSAGRTDLPTGDYEVLMDSLDRLLALEEPDRVIYSGHGEPTSIRKERETNPFSRIR